MVNMIVILDYIAAKLMMFYKKNDCYGVIISLEVVITRATSSINMQWSFLNYNHM